MFINENDITHIKFNIVNKKGSVLTEKYFYFDERGDKEDDAIFMACVLETFINFKGYSKNIDINIFSDSIVINCFYTNLYGKNGGYSKVIQSYLRLMNKIEIIHNEYLKIIDNFN